MEHRYAHRRGGAAPLPSGNIEETGETMLLPQRKSTRIPNFNYASYHYYFVTICTHNKECIFGEPGKLNNKGKIAEAYLLEISKYYPQVVVDKCVVMPNHIHAILVIGMGTIEKNLPSLSRVVGQYKMAVTKSIRNMETDKKVWQRSFHDHIIRNQKSYEKIWLYIENNPLKWEEDCFYFSESKL